MKEQKGYPKGTKVYVVFSFFDEEDLSISIEEGTIEKYVKESYAWPIRYPHYEVRICSLDTINILDPDEVHTTIEGAIEEAEMIVGEKVRKLNRSLKELKKKWRKND